MPRQWLSVSGTAVLAFSAFAHAANANDVGPAQWTAPAKSRINDIDAVISDSGVYGFIFNSSQTSDDKYGTYNWCNMPHARESEYVKASDEYELQYVELIQRHHKRTPYSSNAFPVESYQWNCDDSGLYYYGQSFQGQTAARGYLQGYISPINPFVPSGWIGSCRFPQITSTGLEDSWQHGSDLYGVYHELLGFLPARNSGQVPRSVKYRVTNNVITSQVAGMVINGMWETTEPTPLMIQADSVDSLEPRYSCPGANRLFDSITSRTNTAWQQHLDKAADLYKTLDDISGVPPNDGGFHKSFDHYYDNLSARQCHMKPLPCKLVDGRNSTTCVTQSLAESVYRLGQWEYSRIYRDDPASLAASAASLGVWLGELTAHLRQVISGNREVIYFHNIAHDGSVSRLLSVLQLDNMVWPGMGSEIVFELYRKKSTQQPSPTPTPIAPSCNHDNCLRHFIRSPSSYKSYCGNLDTASASQAPLTTSWPSQCGGNAARVSSACSCLKSSPTTTTSAPPPPPTQTKLPESNNYFIRVLFSGQVLKSSHPDLGLMNMVPANTFLRYLDSLVGEGASEVKKNCQ